MRKWIVVAVSFSFLAQAQIPCGVDTSETRVAETTTFESKDHVTVDYEGLADTIFHLGGTPVQTIKCPDGVNDCLLVAKLAGGSPDLGICAASSDQRCIVTDEFSLAGMILSMARSRTNTERFHAWFNMLQILRGLGGQSDLLNSEGLPSWVARVATSGGTSVTRTDDNDATDGSARSAIALYTAARSAAFDASRRTTYLAAANEFASRVLQHDFVHTTSYPLRGRNVGVILAGGRKQALALCTDTNKDTCDKDTYAGYYGDVVIMLLMAHASTGQQAYLDAARDTAQSYLYAAGFSSTIDKLRVPPITWAWWDNPATAEVKLDVVCKDHSDDYPCAHDMWDGHDAPRAASLCKAAYYWRVLGLTPEADLETYCDKWAQKGMVNYDVPNVTPGYHRQYYVSTGEPVLGEQNSLFSMAVGTNHNFYCGAGELQRRLFVTFNNHFEVSGVAKFDGGPNLYSGAPAIINYGSAIGRDLPVFGAPLAMHADGGDGSVSVHWQTAGGTQYAIARRAGNGPWGTLPTIASTSPYTDSDVSSTTGYLYRVRALRPGGLPSPWSAPDVAVPIAFEDPALLFVPVKKNHIDELRAAANAIETVAGIPPAAFTDPTITAHATLIKATHVSELRNHLDNALAKLGIAATFPAGAISSGTLIHATDLDALRTAVH